MSYYKRNNEQNGIEIYFDKKPSEMVRTSLKENGWRWNGYKSCWYNYYSESHLEFAEGICNGKKIKNVNTKKRDTKINKEKTIDSTDKKIKLSSSVSKKRIVDIGDSCTVVDDTGRQYLGVVGAVNEEKDEVQVKYIYRFIENTPQYKNGVFELKKIRKKKETVSAYQINERYIVEFLSQNNGIVKGRVISESSGYFYSIEYFVVDSEGRIKKYTEYDIPIEYIISVESYGTINPIQVGDKVEFVLNGEEIIGRAICINYDETIDIEYDYVDRWGDKEKNVEYNIWTDSVRLMTRGRIALDRAVYIGEHQQKDIDNNEKIIERIKDKEDIFEDAYSAKSDALYRHQKAGTILADMYNKFAFFYDTGTGKTVMTLDIIANKQEKEGARFLIIAPKSIIKTAWLDDATKFYPNLRILPLYNGFNDDKKTNLLYKWKNGKNYDVTSPYVKLLHAIIGQPDFMNPKNGSIDQQLQEMAHHYIINSELFIRNPEYYIKSLGVNGIIMDESAVLKNYRGKTSETMREVCESMKYVYLLSGKPAPNNVVEYFSQMKIVDPDTFNMTFDRFLGMFCYGPQNTMIESNKKLFAEMVSVRSLIISKKDCLDLPDCVDLVRQIELPSYVMVDYIQLYRECMTIIKGMDASTVFYSAQSKLAVLMKLRQLASGFFMTDNDGYKETRDIIDVHNEKLKELNDILDQLEGEQVIIWGQFQHEIEIIEKELSKRATVVTAYGKTKDLEGAIDAFKTGNAQYIVANPKTLKYGVTFTNCKYVIYYSFSYSAEDYDQSHDRNYRLGQTEQCTYIYLQAADTIDEIMYAKVKYKLSSAEFFEQLIKDASKHGIDYDSLKPKTDEEIKDAMSDDESSLKLILNDIGKKQNKKIIKEYLDKYVANPRECLDLYEPTKDDIVKAVKSCFHKKDIIGDSRTYNLYDDVDIEELLLPWSAYYALKKAGINIVGDLFQNDDDEIYNILGEELFEVVQRRLLTISIMILHECYKKQLKLQEESLVNTIEEIEESDTEKNISIDEMNLSVRSYNCLRRAGITDLYELMKMSSDDFMKIRNLGRKNFYEIIDKMAEYGVGPKDTVECKKNISEFDEVLIEDMELTVRSYNLLRRGGIKTLGDLTRITIDELLKIRNMGRKSLEEILRKMEAFGAKLRQVEEDEGEEDDEWGDLEEFCNDLFEECNKNYDDNQEQYFAESNNVEEDICSGCVTEVDDDKLEVEILNLNPVDMSPLGLVKTRKCDIAIGGAFICTDGIEIAFVFDNKRTSMVEASVYDIFINGNEVTAEGGSCVVFQTGKFLLKKIAKLLCNENQIIDITYKYNLRYNSSNNYFTKTEQVKLQSEYIRHQYSSDYKTQLVNVFSNEIWDVNYVGALLNNDDEKLIFLAKNKSDRKQLFSLCEMNVDGITMAINFGSIYVGAGETKLGLIEPENIFKYDISNKVVGLKATNTYSTYLDEEDKEYICEKICIGEIYDEMYGCAFLKQELKTHHKDYFKAGIRILTQFGELKIHKVIDCSDRWGLCYQLKCIFSPKVTGKVEFRMIINGFTFNENSIDCVNNEEAEITIPLSIKWLRRYGFIYEESYAMTFKVALEDEEDSELETVDEINYIFRMDEIINQSVKPEDGDE